MSSTIYKNQTRIDDVDWVVVELAIGSPHAPDNMTLGERMEATRRLSGMGRSLSQIAEQLRISDQTVLRYTRALKGKEVSA